MLCAGSTTLCEGHQKVAMSVSAAMHIGYPGHGGNSKNGPGCRRRTVNQSIRPNPDQPPDALSGFDDAAGWAKFGIHHDENGFGSEHSGGIDVATGVGRPRL